MELKSISVKETIRLIQKNKLFLPPIQRDFVWEKNRMIRIFDSLYRGYPINNFILWKLLPHTAKQYPLHHFVKTYTEKIYIRKEPAPSNLLDKEVWAVIDGQQRLSSFYIGLSGVYKYKKGRKRNVEANLIPAKLYFNLMSPEVGKTEDNMFSFLNDDDASNNTLGNVAFEVGKILTWENSNGEIDKAYNDLLFQIKAGKKKTVIKKFEERIHIIKAHLLRLYEMINELAVNYLKIDEQNIDEVVEIFTRINSGGMVLKKAELLFSTLVASWSEGESEINGVVEMLTGAGLNLKVDFVMRSCIVLSDLPTKLRLESFNKKNIEKIKSAWPEIKQSLIDLVDILPQIGYNHQKGLSENALIPIAYYIKNGGSVKAAKALNQLKLYYVVSQVNEIFGGQGDQVLEKVRTEFKRQLENENSIIFDRLTELKLPGSKSFKIKEDRIHELIEDVTYSRPHAYFILSLLYPNIDLKTKRLQVDHINPRSKFNWTNLRNHGIDDERIGEWIEEKRDMLSNLQLMDPKDNNYKRSKSLIDYLMDKPLSERRQFLAENMLPKWNNKKLMELENFDEFLEWRSKQIFRKLKTIFKV